MPFFVQQYSCWSSVSPECTRRLCGLNCRQLECGDIILAITEQVNIPSKINQHYLTPKKTLINSKIQNQFTIQT